MPDTPRSERLRLRYVTRGEAHLLHSTFAFEHDGFNDFGQVRARPGDDDDIDNAVPDAAATGPRQDEDLDPTDQLRTPNNGVLFIERLADRRAIGTISYHRLLHGPNIESTSWMIGIELRPEARGQGYGAEAQRLAADWLLETTEANRIEAQTDVENVAEARSLEKAGFLRDGVLRGAQFRAGAYHDLIVFSRLRTDPKNTEGP